MASALGPQADASQELLVSQSIVPAKKKSTRKRKASNSVARTSNDVSFAVENAQPVSTFSNGQDQPVQPAISIAPLEPSDQLLSATEVKSPRSRKSRNQSNLRSQRKTSVDQRYEAEAELNDIMTESQKTRSVRKRGSKSRQLEPLLTTSAPRISSDLLSPQPIRISNDLLKPPHEPLEDAQTVRNASKKKRGKKKNSNAIPYPEDPFDIMMQQAEREPSEISAQTKKVTKKAATLELDGPMQLDMAQLIKLKEESNVPINLNIQMNVDEKMLAAQMMQKMPNLVPQVQIQPPPQTKRLKPQKLRESSSESSESSSSSSSESDEEEKFAPVQRYKVQKPLMLKREQIHRIREPEAFEKKVVIKTKKQVYKEQQAKVKAAVVKEMPTQERESVMMFTDSEDDSVSSDDDEMTENERRLVQVFWRSRNWVILQNQGLFRLLLKQKETCSVIFTPISPDEDVSGADRSIRFVSLETKLDAIIKNLHKGMEIVEGTQPLMMQFLRYISYEKSSIPEKFLLPLERKLILFNDDRQRQLHDERDKMLLIGTFMFIKVLAGKLLFKPYKVTRFFDTEVGNLEKPTVFKENCLGMGYTIIALMTDFLFDLYKQEMERTDGKRLVVAADIARVKQDIFADLMPIADDYVLYKDFSQVNKRSEWKQLITKIRNFINKTLESIQAHKHLTDAGLQVRAQEDLKELIQIRTHQYKQLKKKLSHNRNERLIREGQDDESTESEDDRIARELKQKQRKKKAIQKKEASVALGGGD